MLGLCKMKTLFLSIMFVVSVAVGNAQGPLFFYDSSPTSYIGHGQSESFNRSDWIVNAWSATVSTPDRPPSQTAVIQFFSRFGPSQYFEFNFQTPSNQTFQIGATYQAARYLSLPPFTSAGMSFGGNGRASSDPRGWFTVYDFVTGADGIILSAAFDFYQLDSSGTDQWNFGSIRYNSSVPINYSPSTIPEPSTYAAVFGFAVLGIAFWCRRKSAQTNGVLSVGS